jgi:hypothetical protein
MFFSPFAGWFPDGTTKIQPLSLVILHSSQNQSIIDFQEANNARSLWEIMLKNMNLSS